jgi:DNA polymerase-1
LTQQQKTLTKEERRALSQTRILEHIDTAEVVGLDIETTGLDPRTSKVRLVQVATTDFVGLIDCFRVDPRPVLQALARTTVVAHNAKFEWMHIYHHYGIALDNIRDTMLAAQVLACGNLYGGAGFSLEALVLEEFDYQLDKEMQESDWGGELTERQKEYARRDALVLLPLYSRLTKRLQDASLERVAELEYAALPAVARMELAGLPVDKAAWCAHAEDVARRLKRLEHRMLELEGLPDPEPIKQSWALQGPDCKAMLAAAGIEVEGTTAKDLEPHREHDLVRLLLDYRKARAPQAREPEGPGTRARAPEATETGAPVELRLAPPGGRDLLRALRVRRRRHHRGDVAALRQRA